jgi:exosortase
MDATARIQTDPRPGLMQEFQSFWRALPDKALYGALLAGWVCLFQFFGRTSAVADQNASLFTWMWGKWDDPSNDASYGKLIPFAVLAMLWFRRRRLVSSARGVWWPGLAALGLALALHVAGYVVQQPRLSMVALFAGAWVLVGLVWGWECGKASFFPFAIFAFCVPMGGTFAQGLTLPLRLLAAKGTMFITHRLLEIDVNRAGTQLLDPSGLWSYDVRAACSGIRSFIALLAITTILAGLTMKVLWKKAVIVALSIPLALICNVMRLTTVILAANAFKTQAAGNYVDAYFGYVTYGVALGCVLLVARWLREKPPTESP